MMKTQILLALFIAIIVFYFVGLGLENERMQILFKPLLVGSLIGYFLSSTKAATSLRRSTIGALIFSVIGDTFLLFAQKNDLFFILGLSAFLFAHVCYIYCFAYIFKREKWRFSFIWIMPMGFYYYLLMSSLMPHLDGLTIPVLLYGLIISVMAFLAFMSTQSSNKKLSFYFITGSLLFLISDSVLAINKFYFPFAISGWVIMTTYIAAQYFLVKGMIQYLNGSPSGK